MAALLSIVTISFFLEMAIVKPSINLIAKGFAGAGIFNSDPSYWLSAMGILGATIMPHNLYLHSHLAKQRVSKCNVEDRSTPKQKVNYLSIDLVVALSIAFVVNSSILIVSAAAFHKMSSPIVPKSIEDAAYLLKNTMGTLSFVVFGTALLISGLCSTITGTLAGQIVFEGFLNLELTPWKRRLLTRSLAIIPALMIILISGKQAFEKMLFYSQVVLSFQLPFAIIPLCVFAFSQKVLIDYKEEYDNRVCLYVLRLLSIIVVIAVCALNIITVVLSVRN
jgi:manganese transport protein